MRAQIKALLDTDISAAEIARHTGVDASTVRKLRLGSHDIENLSIKNAEKLVNYYKKVETKMIIWTGKTTDKVKKYTAEGETYYELYTNIQEKYGWDHIIDSDAFEKKVLELNGEDVDDWADTDGIEDFEIYNDWVTDDKIAKVTDEDFKDIIEDSDSEAYYHEFEMEGE